MALPSHQSIFPTIVADPVDHFAHQLSQKLSALQRSQERARRIRRQQGIDSDEEDSGNTSVLLTFKSNKDDSQSSTIAGSLGDSATNSSQASLVSEDIDFLPNPSAKASINNIPSSVSVTMSAVVVGSIFIYSGLALRSKLA
mmetsp:Transcript_87896/g.138748  ORF Transcript_87896/g.138748 Transcript_87896/m.138748 type:complete len:142 (-) Transcript_87896:99-524(-)